VAIGARAPGGQVGAVDDEAWEFYGGDPSSGVGLARPIGWRVLRPDGTGAWDKTGSADTAWTVVGSGVADYDGWFNKQVALMHTAVPGLTNFKEFTPGEYSLSDAYTAVSFLNYASTYEGGGVSPPNNTYAIFGTPRFQTMKTGKWAMAFRARMPAPSPGTFYFIGAMQPGTSNHLVGVSSYYAMSTTKWNLYTWESPTEIGAQSSSSADDNVHDFVITFDGTTLKLYVDGTLEATQTTLTYLTDGARSLACYAQVHGDTNVLRIAYGYIAP
jgi:hypothetical protein